MSNAILKGIIASIVGTAAICVLMIVAGQLGMPTMEPPLMLAATMGVPVFLGWIMHFMIGIIFALMYVYLFRGVLAGIGATPAKGAVLGLVVVFIGGRTAST